jgi:hypothetical protein
MSKISKFLQFSFPLNKKIIKDCRVHIEHLGDLLVTGIAHMDPNVSALDFDDSKYTVEITSITWRNAEVKDLLEANLANTMLASIEDAAIDYASHLFTSTVAA